MKRTASANWKGTGKEGKGTVSTQSGVLNDTQYSFSSRFEEGIGTNPEELVGAAHAGCFTMKLSFVISGAGFTPTNIDTKATVTFENGAIPNVHLDVTASVPGLSAEQFAEMAADAKANCPISKLLNTDITMEAKLV
ncbi:osmotically inducible protein OsmC [Chitinophaga skermanii]|uniref:Osmotically inducible protein OsmC n=1 Tax=Chitinophaga skermanii TaxID=331697 RepID=A0A327QJY9_9BACT|nr:OsmC family protein [Chitinophaga skermanii]RAJ04002.1 osmotically inducible protein OsmC [Chitinophaga skermanii]